MGKQISVAVSPRMAPRYLAHTHRMPYNFAHSRESLLYNDVLFLLHLVRLSEVESGIKNWHERYICVTEKI